MQIVKAPQEATLDSMMLVNLSNMGAVKARAMKSGTGSFDMDDFVAKLITFMGGRKGGEMLGNADDDAEDDYEDPSQPLRWDLIGKKALAKSRRVPVSDYMSVDLSSFCYPFSFYLRPFRFLGSGLSKLSRKSAMSGNERNWRRMKRTRPNLKNYKRRILRDLKMRPPRTS